MKFLGKKPPHKIKSSQPYKRLHNTKHLRGALLEAADSLERARKKFESSFGGWGELTKNEQLLILRIYAIQNKMRVSTGVEK